MEAISTPSRSISGDMTIVYKSITQSTLSEINRNSPSPFQQQLTKLVRPPGMHIFRRFCEFWTVVFPFFASQKPTWKSTISMARWIDFSFLFQAEKPVQTQKIVPGRTQIWKSPARLPGNQLGWLKQHWSQRMGYLPYQVATGFRSMNSVSR